MGNITILLIAIGLAMDAFAVSISCGFSLTRNIFKEAVKISLMFGIFQAGMTLLGWFAGGLFKDVIEPIDHWIAFGLLLFIGIKMIKEAFEAKSCESKSLSFSLLTTLAIATSIDALAVGISFSTLHIPIVLPSIIIGVVALLFSFCGVFFGGKFKNVVKVEKEFEIVGGIILIFIGTRILFSHLGFL